MSVILLILVALGLYLWLGLPVTLKALGLHPDYRGPRHALPGGRALIVTTSHATLDPSGKATGVFGSEFLADSWGAAYDLGNSVVLGQKITEAWAAGKVIGGVCHGPLGLMLAQDVDGKALVKGKRLTAVTDRQVAQLGIQITPQHPERELRAAGAVFENATAFFEPFANHTVVDGRLVTGQNQNAGSETAQKMMFAAGGRARP